ncbi:MAG: hypothetical protein JNK74_01790 [Candidatus Hydrogenedentes bacterium]|nr:hypothetical protein [Candidatus Hydrogenedentota bacterium]
MHDPLLSLRRLGICALALITACLSSCSPPEIARIPVQFTGGHDTDPVDHGRPVVLIAAALGVEPDVFRQAFSGVNPAPAGTAPSGERVHENKAVLLATLGPLGVTNARLDEVSDYYRYSPGPGELWKVREAEAVALVKQGQIIGFEIEDGGAGYTTPPTIRVSGFPSLRVAAQMHFGTDLKTNGSIKGMSVAD